MLPYFEKGVKDALKLFVTGPAAVEIDKEGIPEFQIILKSSQLSQSLRNLTAEHVNKLIKVNSNSVSADLYGIVY